MFQLFMPSDRDSGIQDELDINENGAFIVCVAYIARIQVQLEILLFIYIYKVYIALADLYF